MSQAMATEFLEKANTDADLRQQLETLGTGAKLEDVLDVAAAAGYQFNEKDLMAAAKAKAEAEGKSVDAELNEADLEAVAGGFKINLTIVHITKVSTHNSVVVTIKSNF